MWSVLLLLVVGCASYRPRPDAPTLEALPDDWPVKVYEVGDRYPEGVVLGEFAFSIAVWDTDAHALEVAKTKARELGADAIVVVRRQSLSAGGGYRFLLLRLP